MKGCTAAACAEAILIAHHTRRSTASRLVACMPHLRCGSDVACLSLAVVRPRSLGSKDLKSEWTSAARLGLGVLP